MARLTPVTTAVCGKSYCGAKCCFNNACHGLGNVVGWGRNSSAHGGKPDDTKTGYNLTSWLRSRTV